MLERLRSRLFARLWCRSIGHGGSALEGGYARRLRSATRSSKRPPRQSISWNEFQRRLTASCKSSSTIERLPSCLPPSLVSKSLDFVLPLLARTDARRRACNRAIALLVSAGDMKTATEVALKRMPKPDGFTLALVCSGWMRLGRVRTCLSAGKELQRRGAALSLSSLTTLLRAAGLARDYEFAESLLAASTLPGIAPLDAAFYVAKIVACRFVGAAEDVLDEMRRRRFMPDIHAVIALINVYERAMKGRVIHPVDAVARVRALFNEMLSSGVVPTLDLVNLVAQVFCLAGRTDDALAIVDKFVASTLVRADVITYSTLLNALIRERRLMDWFVIWRRMLDEGVAPNGVALASLADTLRRRDVEGVGRVCFAALRIADQRLPTLRWDTLALSVVAQQLFQDVYQCPKADLDCALTTFERFRHEFGWRPDAATYDIAVLALARRGLPRKCFEFIRLQTAAFGVKMTSVLSAIVCATRQKAFDDAFDVIRLVARSQVRMPAFALLPLFSALDRTQLDALLKLLKSENVISSGPFSKFLFPSRRQADVVDVDDEHLATALVLMRLGRLRECHLSLNACNMSKALLNRVLVVRALRQIAIGAALKDDVALCESVSEHVGQLSQFRSALDIRQLTLLLQCRIDMLIRLGDVFAADSVRQSSPQLASLLPLSTYMALLVALSRLGQARMCKDILADIKTASLPTSMRAFNAVLNAFAFHGRTEECEGLLREAIALGNTPDRVSYNSLLRAYDVRGDMDGFLAIPVRMKQLGIAPDTYTVNTLLAGVGRRQLLKECDAILSNMRKAGVKFDNITYKILVSAYLRAGSVKLAAQVFKDVEKLGDGVSELALRALFSNLREGKVAGIQEILSHFGRRPHDKFASLWKHLLQSRDNLHHFSFWRDVLLRLPDVDVSVVHMFNETLRSFGQDAEVHELNALIAFADSLELRPNERTFALLLSSFGRRGAIENCRVVWSRMQRQQLAPNVFLYTAMIGALGRRGLIEECEELWEQMKSDAIRPTAATYACMMFAFAKSCGIEKCLHLLEDMKKCGVSASARVVAALIMAAGRNGNPSLAEAIFRLVDESSSELNLILLKALLRVYSRNRDWKRCRELLAERKHRLQKHSSRLLEECSVPTNTVDVNADGVTCT